MTRQNRCGDRGHPCLIPEACRLQLDSSSTILTLNWGSERGNQIKNQNLYFLWDKLPTSTGGA